MNPLTSRCLSCGNKANSLPTPRKYDDQETTYSVHPDRDKTLFLRILVFQRESFVVFQSSNSIGKVHVMLARVILCLALILLIFHEFIVPSDVHQGNRANVKI